MVQDIIDGIIGGLTDFIGGLGATLLDFITSLIADVINLFLFPIDSLLTFLFPDLSGAIATFNNGITMLVNAPIGYIAYHIPPLTTSMIVIFITILIGYYSIIWIYRGIILIPHVIHKIKFW